MPLGSLSVLLVRPETATFVNTPGTPCVPEPPPTPAPPRVLILCNQPARGRERRLCHAAGGTSSYHRAFPGPWGLARHIGLPKPHRKSARDVQFRKRGSVLVNCVKTFATMLASSRHSYFHAVRKSQGAAISSLAQPGRPLVSEACHARSPRAALHPLVSR